MVERILVLSWIRSVAARQKHGQATSKRETGTWRTWTKEERFSLSFGSKAEKKLLLHIAASCNNTGIVNMMNPVHESWIFFR